MQVVSIVVIELLSSLVTYLVLRWDRGRLDAYGRARMWNDATFRLAVGGPLVGIPPTLAVGAHVWVTRRGWKRLPLALLAAILTTVAVELLGQLLLWATGLPDDFG